MESEDKKLGKEDLSEKVRKIDNYLRVFPDPTKTGS
jgi:hypothetical protein